MNIEEIHERLEDCPIPEGEVYVDHRRLRDYVCHYRRDVGWLLDELTELHREADDLNDEALALKAENARLRLLRKHLELILGYCPPKRSEWLNDDGFQCYLETYKDAKAALAATKGDE